MPFKISSIKQWEKTMKKLSSLILMALILTACFDKSDEQNQGSNDLPGKVQIPSNTTDKNIGIQKQEKIEYFVSIDSFKVERTKKIEKAYVRLSIKKQTLSDRIKNIDLLVDDYFLKSNIESEIPYYVLTDLYVPSTFDFMGGFIGARTSRLQVVDFVMPGQGRLKKMVHKKLYTEVGTALSKKVAPIQVGEREFLSVLFYEDNSNKIINSLKKNPNPRDLILLRKSRQLVFDSIEFFPLDETLDADLIAANKWRVEDINQYEVGHILLDNDYYKDSPLGVQVKILIIRKTSLI
jgi:hypothetical protein